MLGNSDRALYWEMKSDFAIITEIDGARIFTKEGIFLLRAFIGITFDFGSWNEECIALKLFKCMNNIDYLATNEPFNDFSIDEIEEGLIGLNDATLFFTKFKQRQSLLLAISRLHLIIPIPKDDGSEESEKLIQLRNFDQFAEQISILRICEIMNHQPFNILITYAELKTLTIPNLLKRHCNRSLHFEALRIANFMGIDTSFISAHWANCLIRTKLSPKEINEKLLEMEGQIDLIGLAMTAFLIQKEEIAFKLLDLCSTKSRCVPILLNQKNWNECLEYSILSEDSSLMAYTFEEVNKYDKKNLRKITSKNEISFNLMLDILK